MGRAHSWLTLRVAGRIGVAWLVAGSSGPAAASDRWPAWPSEIERIAAPLHDPQPTRQSEQQRVEALERLATYATAAMARELIHALGDPSPAVQREALRLCALRELRACAEAAASLWHSAGETSLKMAALRVMALQPDAATLVLLFAALRDPGDEMRAHAADLLGLAALPADTPERSVRREVQAALLAKLSDPDAQVRTIAARSLGRLGPGDGTLALTRLLDDPEPTVRTAAATALAHRRDPHGVPALLRSLHAPNEPPVRVAVLGALARLPGAAIPAALLAVLDEPPEGVTAFQVAEAIGARPSPEPELLTGLLDRLADDRLARPVLRALLLLGSTAAPALRAALDRGLDPALHDALDRLWRATQPVKPSAAIERDPDPEVLRIGSPGAQLEAVAELVERRPAWFVATLRHRLGSIDEPVEQMRPWWLAASTGGFRRELDGLPWRTWAQLLRVAADRRHTVADRCLALAASASAPPTHTRRMAKEITPFVGDPDPAVRACVGHAAARMGLEDIVGVLLLDAEPAVRSRTVLALRRERSAAIEDRLRILAAIDPSGMVRQVAAHRSREPAAPGDPLLVVPVEPHDPARPATPMARVTDRDDQVWWVPVQRFGDVPWAWLPPR